MGENEANNELLDLAKECLGIVASSTGKDKEITMLINAAKEDLERVEINIEEHSDKDLIKNTIILYVKAHFGDTDINKRNEYLKRYTMNLRTLQNSEEYTKKEGDDSNA